MAKILHTADFHLDSAFTALPEEKARLRRQEARQLTDRLVDYANDHGVELLLLAGDLFDSDQLYGQTAQELARSLARFRGHAVIAPGNHDFYAASSPYARLLWPENVHILSLIHISPRRRRRDGIRPLSGLVRGVPRGASGLRQRPLYPPVVRHRQNLPGDLRK